MIRNILLSIVLFTFPNVVFGLDTVTLYHGSCKTDTGVIIRVNKTSIFFISYTGEIKEIPRYDIIGIAIYSVPQVRFPKINNPKKLSVPFYKFETFRNGEVVPLAEGWPIGFSRSLIQLLRSDMSEVLINRDEIWGVYKSNQHPIFENLRLKETMSTFKLAHPLVFEKCPKVIIGNSRNAPLRIIPVETLPNPIQIKKFLDSLNEGIGQIDDYEDRQRFYAVPQYYRNSTRLGSWAVANSRYANIGSRQGNFLPLVEDELSEGPFGFQRVARSGLYPIQWTSNAEANVQVFYGLKADYIKLELFMDPTRVLIGDEYRWEKDDLLAVEDRPIESSGGMFGFDFGYFSIGTALTTGDIGIRTKDYFENIKYSTAQVSLGARYNNFVLNLYIAGNELSSGDGYNLDNELLNLVVEYSFDDYYLAASFIDRTIFGRQKTESIDYKAQHQTISLLVKYQLNHRWDISVQPIMEKVAAGYVDTDDNTSLDASKHHYSLSSGATISF